MTTVDRGPDTSRENVADAKAAAAGLASSRKRRPGWRLLLGQPLFVAVVVIAWAIWRSQADLDSIEKRQLDWTLLGRLTLEHLKLTVVATVIVLAIAVPLGIALTRPRLRRAAPLVVAFANAGQAAPVIGLIVLLAIWLGFGFWTAILALCLYAILPVLRNTIVGLQGVDPTLVEAGRGMGMSNRSVLGRIELPLAVPVIMAGIRTALVLVVGTATLATFIDAGGLGGLITTGIRLLRYPVLISGAILVAALALLIDWAGRVLEEVTRPRGLE
ncbi:ABC transporter permease [Kribbella antibiotica]|uniref:ABC transporter permease n=1 Tax=Kribbella antibiotica TaxID=190195 RepID=A0A4R4ZIX6_9ACTN|nr:ABC transporter permease [Kribbella antibiotica]TDD57479.1 ABC transporter permease [Kribbella antibiotica]